jgi:membrane protein implicated in regulation of membrane protease activity
MNKSILSLTIFISMSLIVAFLMHKKVKQIILACVVSSIISSVIYQILGVIVVGYLDPFIIPAFLNSLTVSFIVAVIVSIPFAYTRFKAEKRLNKTDSGNDKRDASNEEIRGHNND